jgi:hypothetical protein
MSDSIRPNKASTGSPRVMKRGTAMRIAGLPGALLAAAVAAAAATGHVAGEGMLWPLDLEPAVSSSFCEYREGHFHAGIDIRTFGAEGVPCVAAANGYVSRLRASPEGYGKAIYVQLESGETIVYAHLAEFEPELERVLYEAQKREGRFSVDVRFSKNRFPVGRGEVIAYSGSTGGIAPHLHFEVRDVGEHPLNPFSNGFALSDSLPPVFRALEFVPLAADGTVGGRCWPVGGAVRRVGPGRYTVPDTLAIAGDVGVSVEVFDRLGNRSGRLAPYRITLSVDDSLVADIRLERFSFAHTDQVDFLYDISRVRREKVFYYQLFESEGERVSDRHFRSGGRLGAVGAGIDGALHHATVAASDCAGNVSELSFQFRSSPRAAHGKADAADRVIRTDIPGYFFRDGFVSVWDDSVRRGLEVRHGRPDESDTAGSDEGDEPRGVFTAADLRDGAFAVPQQGTATGGEAHLFGVEKDLPTSVNLTELSVQMIFGERSLYTDMVFYALPWRAGGRAANPGELVPRFDPVRIGPSSARLRSDVEIRFLVDRLDSTTAIYRLNERKGKWVYYKSIVYRGVVSTTVRRPGVYAVFADKYGPRIRRPFVRTWRSYATGETRPQVVVPMEDTGSGVDHRKTSVYLAGIEQVAYWDSRSKKLLVVIRDQNIMGPQTISIVAYDNIGNRSHLETTVDIPHTLPPQGND